MTQRCRARRSKLQTLDSADWAAETSLPGWTVHDRAVRTDR
ncbi:MAG: maleylpyruvate isomerase N-terminal domain-containing protein [Actinomycetia bacterium]|nr:maleylpyruvate isomerase N-terminal domain-containing protein [Actinomycetes bacterium]MCH9709985.1 maleylpyruvate isomerase N-terminal domain-containing protein [Actinomycetes bacterium]MCH9767928.1 maleylpyruvate isomerase N-terminal domain-containing protein [Actinomycetes bacterium]